MTSTKDPSTFVDEIEAWTAAGAHFDRILSTLTRWQLQTCQNKYAMFDERANGGVRTLWVDNRIRCMAVVVRNDWNRSVLVITDMETA